MINKKSILYSSSDRKSTIYACMWQPDEVKYPRPAAVLQICHGMNDYIERYEEIANYMAKRGFLVVGNDHLGHGKSAATQDDLGYMCEDNPEQKLTSDVLKLTKQVKKMYPNVPYFLLGHSMGSFIARRYISIYGNELDGVILLGTGQQNALTVKAGKLLCKAVAVVRGDRYRSMLLTKMIFSSYNSRIKPVRTDFDWLSTDEAIVDEYCNDPLSRFLFTVNGYLGLLNTIDYIIRKDNVKTIPQELPMLMMSGLKDPVGEYGKGVSKAYKMYHNRLSDTELVLYPKCRHELHNEYNREEIFGEIYNWIMEHISRSRHKE